MNTNFYPTRSAPSYPAGHAPGQTTYAGAAGNHATRPLWAAVGVLSVTVLAMGGAMLYSPGKASSSAATSAAAQPAPGLVASVDQFGNSTSKTAAVGDGTAPAATKNIANSKQTAPLDPRPAPQRVAQQSPRAVANQPTSQTGVSTPARSDRSATGSNEAFGQGPAPTVQVVQAPPPKPVCINCGTVESVTPVERQGKTNGVGAVAGGVLGAVVGNQVGKGSGKTAATVLGAIGGGQHGREKHPQSHRV
jgi:outer membrane lipoprotein SlyB